MHPERLAQHQVVHDVDVSLSGLNNLGVLVFVVVVRLCELAAVDLTNLQRDVAVAASMSGQRASASRSTAGARETGAWSCAWAS
eukprot:scaffold108144_cov18-Tisochrysis_lutea.AAC.1